MAYLFRKFPLFKGKQKLAKLLLKNTIKETQDIWVKGKFGCKYFLPNLIENVSFEIYIDGIYEQPTSDFLAKKIPQEGVFLDLGANIGGISIPLCKLRRDIRAVCVEASPRIFGYMEKNLNSNGLSGIDKVNKALFYTDNVEMDFFSPEEKFGKGSLSPVFTTTSKKVTTLKIDTLVRELHLPRVDFIKIDVEGYEYHVFKGGMDLLSPKNAPDILFEFVDWAEEQAEGISVGEAQRLLRSLGYRIFYFNVNAETLTEVKEVILKGFYMLYATKK